jgi:hypothetical protein
MDQQIFFNEAQMNTHNVRLAPAGLVAATGIRIDRHRAAPSLRRRRRCRFVTSVGKSSGANSVAWPAPTPTSVVGQRQDAAPRRGTLTSARRAGASRSRSDWQAACGSNQRGQRIANVGGCGDTIDRPDSATRWVSSCPSPKKVVVTHTATPEPTRHADRIALDGRLH